LQNFTSGQVLDEVIAFPLCPSCLSPTNMPPAHATARQ
jgi:hypothetical protein